MTKRYFSLLERDDGVWRIEFGAYDRDDVEAEREDRKDHGVKISNLKIISTGAKQVDIDAAVAKLNKEVV